VSDQRDENDENGEDRVIYHPNRDKATSKATKAIVVLLLLVSVGLMALITIGGWKNLQGAKIVAVGFIIVYLIMAYYVNKWQRGVLPLAAGLAIVLGVFAAIAAFSSGSWFDRDHTGYDQTGLPPTLIGMLCVILLPVLLLLIAFAMRAFAQKWNIEIEMDRDEYEEKYGSGRQGRGGGGYGQAQPAGG
jgi:lysylphosphatidylglycerol synthetase-like protein (DUF2156 family)